MAARFDDLDDGLDWPKTGSSAQASPSLDESGHSSAPSFAAPPPVTLEPFGDELDMPPEIPLEAYETEVTASPHIVPAWIKHPDELPSDWADPIDLFKTGFAKELPLELLPEPIRTVAADIAPLIGCGIGEVAMSALSAISGAADHRFGCQPKRQNPGYVEHPNIWVSIVGPSGNKKSAGPKIMLRPIQAIEKLLYKQCVTAEETNAQNILAHENAKKAWASKKDDIGNTRPEPPERIALPRLLVNDTTIQKLGIIANDNPRGLLLYRDEQSGWLGSMDQFTRANADRAHWLSAYDGGPCIIDRVERGTMYVNNFSVGLLGTITPSAIRQFSGKLNEDGLLQRMIICNQVTNEIGEDREANPKAWQAYCDVIENLYDLNCLGERRIRLSQPAQDIYNDFLVQLYALKDASIFGSAATSHISKWESLAIRIMLLYHLSWTAQFKGRYPDEEIPGEIAAQVCKLLLDWLLGHTIEFWINVLGQSAHSEHVRWIADYILAHELTEITQRELQRHYSKWDGLSEPMKMATFNALNDGCWTAPNSTIKNKSGMPRSHRVNPKVHKWTERASKEKARRAHVVSIFNAMGKDRA